MNRQIGFSTVRVNYWFLETSLAFGFFLLCFAALLPDLFFLKATPMGGDSLTLKDPAVSWAAFMPSFREFRFELLQHGNILWSNLRGMGLPMLGNGVQGAPLFPLNLALVWLPDQLYWSVMPMLRVVFIAFGIYLLARRVFTLSVPASLVLALMAGFNLNVIRWINHPWQNGILAGVWYLYFCCSVFASTSAKRSVIGLFCLGLIISVFAMVTSGFPEASAVAAIFAVFLFIGFVLTGWQQFRKYFGKRLALLALCHVIGFCLSAVQGFALLEFIEHSEIMALRQGYISATFRTDQALPFALAQFSHFRMVDAQQYYLNFYVGLFGTFFFVYGLLHWPRMPNRRCIGIAFLSLMLLYVVKSFGLAPLIEAAFLKIPVLNQSHFPLYYSPLLYFGIAYFVALGIESLMNFSALSRNQKLVAMTVSISATILVLLLSAYSHRYFHQAGWRGVFTVSAYRYAGHLWLFVAATMFLILYQALTIFKSGKTRITQPVRNRAGIYSIAPAAILVVWLLLEVNHSLFTEFAKPDHWNLNLSNKVAKTFAQLTDAPVPRHELRGNDGPGNYVGQGIATVNDGIAAVMPPDQRWLRFSLFNSQFGGYFPMDTAVRPWSWNAISTNLVAINTTPRVADGWSLGAVDTEIYPSGVGWDNISVSRVQPFQLQGTVHGQFKAAVGIRPWIHFAGQHQDFWVKGTVTQQKIVGRQGERVTVATGWRVVIPQHWLKEDSYRLTIRQVFEADQSYADITPIELNFVPTAIAAPMDNAFPEINDAPLLAASPDESLHVYYNAKALPRAYVANSCLVVATVDSALSFLLESDAVLNGRVALEKNDALPADLCASYTGKFRRVPIETDLGSKLELGAITGPALVILNDYLYPGWRAIDQHSGETFKIVRSNLIFRAVYLPENREYQLQLKYHPWWLNLVYGLLVLAMLVGLLTWRWLGKSTSRESIQFA